MGSKAKPEDKGRCVGDGMEVLQRSLGQTTRSFKTSEIVDHFLNPNLELLTSEKEGGFVVAPDAIYKTKAREITQKNFKQVSPGPLTKEKSRALMMCGAGELTALQKKCKI
ncbi:hypothetical protein HPB47_028064 [Ixodes persulcatus]|uniref:Uncharacterized protein n=1 Tax=Ixodes persulcatus TaxID=34615 RepID=A0AC60PUE1_IXOPE|nr:hypothetical protein HPB47_028064 [Ixodes persulcatus]